MRQLNINKDMLYSFYCCIFWSVCVHGECVRFRGKCVLKA